MTPEILPLASPAAQLTAARYAFHRVIVYRYTLAAIKGEMSEEFARAHYDEAMRNFDDIVGRAGAGASQEHNAADMAKGAQAISDLLDESLKRNG